MRLWPRVFACLLFAGIVQGTSLPAFAQLDLTGIWAPPRPYQEDEPERGPGPALVEFLRLAHQRLCAAVGIGVQTRPTVASGAPVPGSRRGIHSPRAACNEDLGGERFRHASTHRDPRGHQHVRTAPDHLDGRETAPFGERAPHVDGLFNRCVGREHAHCHYNSREAGVGAA